MIGHVWPKCWCCYVCRRERQQPNVHAVVRVFSGVGGGGWPACEEHRLRCYDDVAKSIAKVKAAGYLSAGYEISAEAVDADESGWPYLTRTLWTVQIKSQYSLVKET